MITINTMVPAVFVLVLGLVHLTCAVSDSLTMLSTLIPDKTQFPEFSIVMMVNDIPVEYYDNDLKRFTPRGTWRSHDKPEEADLKNFVAEDIYGNLKRTSLIMKKHYNRTQGVEFIQQFLTCQLAGEKVGKFKVFHASGGEELSVYNLLSQSRNVSVSECALSKSRMDSINMIYTNMYQPLCLKTLTTYLRNKNVLVSKESPRVTMMQKAQLDSGRTQVSCLATSFYPQNISMTLLRNGQPVPDQELTGAGVLPNGDGTYQLRRSLSVSEEELKERHLYTCTVKHLSVDDSIDVNWDPAPSTNTAFICVVLIFILIGTAVIITAIIMWRRRQTGSQNDVRYTTAHKTEQSDSSSVSSSLEEK